MKIDRERTASFEVDPQRGFTPLCPRELPARDIASLKQRPATGSA